MCAGPKADVRGPEKERAANASSSDVVMTDAANSSSLEDKTKDEEVAKDNKDNWEAGAAEVCAYKYAWAHSTALFRYTMAFFDRVTS